MYFSASFSSLYDSVHPKDIHIIHTSMDNHFRILPLPLAQIIFLNAQWSLLILQPFFLLLFSKTVWWNTWISVTLTKVTKYPSLIPSLPCFFYSSEVTGSGGSGVNQPPSPLKAPSPSCPPQLTSLVSRQMVSMAGYVARQMGSMVRYVSRLIKMKGYKGSKIKVLWSKNWYIA